MCIYSDHAIGNISTIKKYLIVESEGNRKVSRQKSFQNDEVNNVAIPQGWKSVRLGEIFSCVKGVGLSKVMVREDGKNECILYGELYTTYSNIIMDIVSRTDSLEGKISQNGDLLIPCSTTTSAIDLATASSLNKGGVLLGGDISILRAKDNAEVCSDYYAYYLSRHKGILSKFGQGITIVHLYFEHFKIAPVLLPPLPEQQAIAEVLDEWDKGISLYSHKIELAKKLKKGMMQRLFKRGNLQEGKPPAVAPFYNPPPSPPNTSEQNSLEWREVRLGDVVQCLTSNLTDKDINKTSGVTPVYGADGISGYLPSGAINEDYISIVKDGAGVGRISFRKKNTSVVGTMNALVTKSSNINIRCLFYHLLSFRFDKYIVGSTIPHIYFKDYSCAKIKLPSLKTQHHIATQLTEVDKEIELLERKHASLQEQRKWLLDNLVTGKVRLPEFAKNATYAQGNEAREQ